jgi:hypothetical protein
LVLSAATSERAPAAGGPRDDSVETVDLPGGAGGIGFDDPSKRTVVAQTRLASSPDYVRWVEPTGEVWVTQPDEERIEVFALSAAGPPTPAHRAFLAVPGGPESLVVDVSRGRAYTHLWSGTTVAIDVAKRAKLTAVRSATRCAPAMASTSSTTTLRCAISS